MIKSIQIKLVICLAAILFCSLAFSQGKNSDLDSLYQVYLSEEDEFVQLKLLNKISIHMMMKDRGLAVELAGKAIKLSVKTDSLNHKAKAYYNYGYLMRYQAKGDSSLFYLYKSKKIFEKLKDTSQLGYIYTQLSANYSNLGDKVNSISMMDSAAQFWEATKEYALVSRSLSILGQMYGQVGIFESSLKIGLKSLDIAEKLNDSVGIIRSYSSLAGIYSKLDDNEMSKKYYYKALNISSRHGDQITRYLVYSNLGTTFNSNLQYDSALWAKKQALILLDTNARPNYYADLSVGLANAYLHLEDYPNMKIHLDIANQVSNAKGYKKHFPIIQRLNGDYYNYGKQDGNTAEKYYKKGLEIAQQQGRFDVQGEFFKRLVELAKNRDDEKEAFKYSELLLEHTDSAHRQGKEVALRNSKIELDLEKKDLQITLLSKESELKEKKSNRQRLIIFGSLLLALLIGILGLLRLKQSRLKEKLKLEKFRNKVATDLHDDVGSILTAVAMQSEILGEKSSSETKPKLDKISKLSREAMESMRDTVWAIDSTKDKVENLVDKMKDFLAQMFEDNESIRYVFDFTSEEISTILTPVKRQNIYLIFKEAVTNVVKHSNGDLVSISLKEVKENLELEITDNGTETDSCNVAGLGLKSMKSRAELINAKLSVDRKSESFDIKLVVSL